MAAKKTTAKKSSSAKKQATKNKASSETGRWNGHKFVVSAKLIRGFNGLPIKGSNETEDKKKSGQIYVTRKNGRPAEITMTAHLNAFTGCNVRSEALKFVEQAQKGASDYFYIGNKKLVTYKLLLTDATVKEVQIAYNHTWVNAEVQLTFKQTGVGGTSVNNSSKSNSGGGSSGGGGSGSGGSYSMPGSKKVSTKTSSPVSVGTQIGAAVGSKVLGKAGTAIGAAAGAAVGTAVGMVKNALSGASASGSKALPVKSANSTIGRITSAAKTYSSTKKPSGSGGGITRYAATK